MSISKVKIDNTTHEIIPNGITYCTCSTAEGTAAKVATVVSGNFSLFTGARVVVKFTNKNSASSPTLNVGGTGAKPMRRYGSTAMGTDATTSGWIAGAVQAFTYDGTAWVSDYWDNTLPTASSSTLGGIKIGSNINISDGKISVPTASGTTAGVTIVYPAASCTTFSSDSGTVTPLAVQKGAKMFAITRPSDTTNKAITRYSNTTGDVQDSKIIIEDVTNSRDTSKTAQVIAIPAEGGKKMVYGYCTDQVDGTSFIGGVFDADATSYPYTGGLAIGGTSGNLLWKGVRVATTSDIPSVGNGTVTIKQNGTNKGSFTLNQSGNATIELTDTDTNTTYNAATQSAAGLMSAADKTKLDGIATGANKITVDTALSSSSTNPVQNKVINTALAGKAPTSHTHTKSQITDFPTSMPASDVSAWAKASSKPTYTASEVGALPISGGSLTGPLTLTNGGLYTDYSIYMKHNVFYNSYGSDGNPCMILGLSDDVLYLGSMSSYPHSGSTIINSSEKTIGLRAGGNSINLVLGGINTTAGDYRRVTWNTYGESVAYLTCAANGISHLGSSTNKWKNVYATTGTIQTSDRNVKKNIEDIDDRYIQLFDLVRPVTYQLLKGDRVHTGFISQEVEEAMEKVGLTAEELGFFCKDIQVEIVEDEDGKEYQKQVLDENGNPVYIYSLRYEEYIAIMAEKVKRLEAKYNEKIEKLETKLIELENKLI